MNNRIIGMRPERPSLGDGENGLGKIRTTESTVNDDDFVVLDLWLAFSLKLLVYTQIKGGCVCSQVGTLCGWISTFLTLTRPHCLCYHHIVLLTKFASPQMKVSVL